MPLPDTPNSHDTDDTDDVIRIRREPLYVWLARFTWVIVMILLLEYALKSHQEHEPQAAITAGALFLIMLLAGVIVEVVRHVESQPESRLLRDMARANQAAARNAEREHTAITDVTSNKHMTDFTGDKDVLYE